MLSLANVGEDQLAAWKDLVDIGDHVFVAGEVITSKRGELLGARRRVAHGGQGAAAAARGAQAARRGDAGAAALRRPRRPSRGAAGGPRRASPWSRRSGRALRRRGYLEIETPMLQTHARRRGRAAVRHPLERVRHRPLPAHRARAVPQARRRRRPRAGVRDEPQLPQRGRRLARTRPSSRCSSSTRRTRTTRSWPTITRELIQEAAIAACGSLTVTHHDGSDPRPRRECGRRSTCTSRCRPRSARRSPRRRRVEHLVALCEKDGIEFHPTAVPGKLVEELFEHHVVPTFTGPTFVMDYPVDTSPLVRGHRTKPGVVEKWDLYINGARVRHRVLRARRPGHPARAARRAGRRSARAATSRRCTSTRTSCGRWSTACRRWAASASASIALLMALTGLGIRETILFPLVKPEQRGHERDQKPERG